MTTVTEPIKVQAKSQAGFTAFKRLMQIPTAVVGLVIIVLFAFLFLPQLGEMLKNFQPKPPF